jgi:hypothetical protein
MGEVSAISAQSWRFGRTITMVLNLTHGAIALPGCQVDVGGQTLPSGYYLQDDIQYFPAGPRMKLWREAAAQKAFKEEEALRAARPAPP